MPFNTCVSKKSWRRFACGLALTLVAAGGADAAKIQTLYSFQGAPDGAAPVAAVTKVGGALYGTTQGGGTSCGSGCGTVFSVNLKTGAESVVHSFSDTPDGAEPYAGLLNVKGTLYGTTYNGGANNEGIVFSIKPSGTEKVLYSFCQQANCEDGAGPIGGLIDVGGTLYGTTESGGIGGGTIFSITPSGTEKVLYAFRGDSDGMYPFAGLISVKGKLYGTTFYGGTTCGCGTVFSFDPNTGIEKVLYSFQGGSTDGGYPAAALTDVGGTLYGTTEQGGAGNCSKDGLAGCGTVFSVELKSHADEKVLYSFQGTKTDGAFPGASLINVQGTLYGTTEEGGIGSCGDGVVGCGTVFSLTLSGTETLLYRFSGSNDGGSPEAGLINARGTLYSTTYGGGLYNAGTVFSINP